MHRVLLLLLFLRPGVEPGQRFRAGRIAIEPGDEQDGRRAS